MRWDTKLVLTAAWTFAGILMCVAKPNMAPGLLVLAAVAPLLWYPRAGGPARHLLATAILTRILLFAVAYLVVNATWSTAPVTAHMGVVTLFVGVVILHIVTRTVPFLDNAPVHAMAIGSYLGFAVGAVFLCYEVLSDHQLHLRLFALVSVLAPQISNTAAEATRTGSLPTYFLNRHIAALVILLWPTLLIARHMSPTSRACAALVICLVPVVVAVYGSDHETSKLALAGGAIVFCASFLAPRAVKVLVAAGWVFACVAVVPLSAVAYQQQVHKAKWLQESAKHRIVIWGVTSSKIAAAPVLGHGLSAARETRVWDKKHPVYEPDSPFLVSLDWHAHNMFLQVWFDTGLVGVALLLGIGLLTLREVSRTPVQIQPFLYAAFASNALMAASSFSAWASWVLATYMLCAIFSVLAAKFSASMHREV